MEIKSVKIMNVHERWTEHKVHWKVNNKYPLEKPSGSLDTTKILKNEA